MNKINLLDSLQEKNRRRTERRSHSRRTIDYAFGSDEWIEAIESSYVFWPKEDRRTLERRSVARRTTERRIVLQKHHLRTFRQQTLKKKVRSYILTEEERQMLLELNQRH